MAVIAKEDEVRNLAKNLGVENYIGTERFNQVQMLISEWEKRSQNMNALQKESAWMDVQREIESLLQDMSLDANHPKQLWLLGNSGSSVSYADVRAAFLDGWERTLSQYSSLLQTMETGELRELDTWRDAQLAQIPEFGSAQGKNDLIADMQAALAELENELSMGETTARRSKAKEGIGQRETTRSILMAQATADYRAGHIDKAEYEEIKSLIGPGGLFQGQLSALGQFGDNPDALFAQMDQALAAARGVLRRTEGREGLSGGNFITTNRSRALGGINQRLGIAHRGLGDGWRTNTVRPETRGEMPPAMRAVGTYYEGGASGQPWVGIPDDTKHQQMTVVNNPPENASWDPRNEHRYISDPMEEPSSRPGSPYQEGAKPGMFGTVNNLRDARMGGIHGNGTMHSGPLAGQFFPDADKHVKSTLIFWLGVAGVAAWWGKEFFGDPIKRATAKDIRTKTKAQREIDKRITRDIAETLA